MRVSSRLARIGFTVAVGSLIVACSSWVPQEPSLAGWPLGEQLDCAGIASSGADTLTIAKANIDPGGVSTAIACYSEGGYLDQGSPFHLIRSGGVVVVAFTFPDGTRKGVGVYCAASCSIAEPVHAKP